MVNDQVTPQQIDPQHKHSLAELDTQIAEIMKRNPDFEQEIFAIIDSRTGDQS